MPLVICANCRHYRKSPDIVPFSSAELGNPGVLEAKLKWDEDQRIVLNNEKQRYENHMDFDYEPNFYPWCEAFTPYNPNQFDPQLIERQLEIGDLEDIREQILINVGKNHELLKLARGGNLEAIEKLVGIKVDPATGKIKVIYALCARLNPEGNCILFEKKNAN